MSKSRITGMDCTVKAEWYSEEEMKELLKKHCREWACQLEKGDKSGYEHYQIRVKLKEKRLINDKNQVPALWKGHFLPTTTAMVGNYDYCSKDFTRVAGPWKHDDAVMTRQLTDFLKMELRPWQKKVLNWGNEYNDRCIDLIYDPKGNMGKSIFAEYLEYVGMAEDVPPMREMEKLMGWVATRPIKPMYIFDMPRGMKKDKLADFYAGIEVLKNGRAYDWRHQAASFRFTRPRIIVFTNCLPEFELMSTDRWNVHDVVEGFDLLQRTDIQRPSAGEGEASELCNK